MSPQISIIIVSYNTCEMTIECIRSVFTETRSTDFEIIIFDNASIDTSPDKIAGEFGKEVTLIRSQTNVGFAAGNNRAAQYASGKYLLLLNPDTIVLDRAIDRLYEFTSSFPNAGVWGGRTIFADGSLNPASCWSRQTLWSLASQALGLSSLARGSTLLNPEGIGGWNRDGIRSVDIVSGCFLLISRPIWESLNGFDERFFMYGEEADLCLRARKQGYKPVVTSKSTIVHYGGASETVKADKLVRLLHSKMLLIEMHFSSGFRIVGKVLLALWPLSRFISHAALAMVGRRDSANRAETWRTVLSDHKKWLSLNASGAENR